jgi:hypothetical protein
MNDWAVFTDGQNLPLVPRNVNDRSLTIAVLTIIALGKERGIKVGLCEAPRKAELGTTILNQTDIKAELWYGKMPDIPISI